MQSTPNQAPSSRIATNHPLESESVAVFPIRALKDVILGRKSGQYLAIHKYYYIYRLLTLIHLRIHPINQIYIFIINFDTVAISVVFIQYLHRIFTPQKSTCGYLFLFDCCKFTSQSASGPSAVNLEREWDDDL